MKRINSYYFVRLVILTFFVFLSVRVFAERVMISQTKHGTTTLKLYKNVLEEFKFKAGDVSTNSSFNNQSVNQDSPFYMGALITNDWDYAGRSIAYEISGVSDTDTNKSERTLWSSVAGQELDEGPIFCRSNSLRVYDYAINADLLYVIFSERELYVECVPLIDDSSVKPALYERSFPNYAAMNERDYKFFLDFDNDGRMGVLQVSLLNRKIEQYTFDRPKYIKREGTPLNVNKKKNGYVREINDIWQRVREK